MKQNAFFINFQGLSVATSFPRPETAPLTILAVKSRLLCNFVKTSKDHHFIGHSGTGLKLSTSIDF